MKKKLLSIRHKILFRNEIARLQSLKGLYQGKRCFIMGNGPSLNHMDLTLFKNEFVWGSNRCYLLYNRIDWRPKFYSAVDERVVPDIAGELNDIIQNDETDTLYFIPLWYRRNIMKADNVYWFDLRESEIESLPFRVFSTDPSDYVPGVATVTIALLQLAIYLGFNPIYLIGCDTNYKIPKTVIHEGDAGLISTENDDANHFSPYYFGKNSKWHEPFVEKMIWHYEQAKTACELLEIQVLNATVGGKLEVFPRINYLDLF